MMEKPLHTEHPDGRGRNRAWSEQEDWLRALIENSPDAITRWDRSLKLVFANAAFVEKSGTPLNEAVGKTSIEMGHPPEIAQAFMDKLQLVFDTGRPQEHYNYYPGPDGTMYMHSRIVPEMATDGTVYTVLCLARDGTSTRNIRVELDELNRRLMHKDRINEALLEELGAFTRVIGGSYADALQKAYTSLEFLITNDARHFSNEGRASLRRVQASLQRMKLMTDDLVAFSKIEAAEGSLTEVNLNQVLEIVKGELEPKLRRTGAVIESDVLPRFHGYAMLVSLLFYHLLDNAGKFVREGLQPLIKVSWQLVNSNGHTYYVISFRDNGIGFGEDKAEGLFELFNRHEDRQRYKGSGIGLAVCKKIMDLHGGLITTESIPGEGSVFSCWFPSLGKNIFEHGG